MSKSDKFTKVSDSRFTLRIPSELLESIKQEAEVNKRSTGKQVEYIIEEWLKQNPPKDKNN